MIEDPFCQFTGKVSICKQIFVSLGRWFFVMALRYKANSTQAKSFPGKLHCPLKTRVEKSPFKRWFVNVVHYIKKQLKGKNIMKFSEFDILCLPIM